MSSLFRSPWFSITVAVTSITGALLSQLALARYKKLLETRAPTFQRKRIFITGATGFIGSEVAVALRRVGHDVYGLVRSLDSSKAIALQAQEVQLIQGDLTTPETFASHLPTMDVIIHTAADYSQYAVLDNNMLQAVFNAGKQANHRIKFLYTSGILVYPNSPNLQTEEDDTMHSGFVVADRVTNERRVVEASEVEGVVIRPSYVFGRGSGHFFPYLTQALSTGSIHVLKPSIAWSEIHIDDLVDAYIRIVNAGNHVVAHQIFNVADSSRNTNLEIAQAFAKCAPGDIMIATEKTCPSDERSQWSNKTVLVSSTKLTHMLGWQPRKKLLLEDVDVIAQAWKSKQQLGNQ